jgi:hypothetical protein
VERPIAYADEVIDVVYRGGPGDFIQPEEF